MTRWRIVQSSEYAQVVASVGPSIRAALAEVYAVLAQGPLPGESQLAVVPYAAVPNAYSVPVGAEGLLVQDLGDGELAAGEIAGRFAISGPSISRHLAILKAAGLVRDRRDGNRILYALEPDRLALTVGDFLSAVCPTQVVLRRRRARSGGGSP